MTQTMNADGAGRYPTELTDGRVSLGIHDAAHLLPETLRGRAPLILAISTANHVVSGALLTVATPETLQPLIAQGNLTVHRQRHHCRVFPHSPHLELPRLIEVEIVLLASAIQ